jgi:hypothetical protein
VLARFTRFATLSFMGFPPVTLWSDGVHRCVLRRTDGQFELLLYDGGRVTRLQTCPSEHDARGTAQEWLIALEELRHH